MILGVSLGIDNIAFNRKERKGLRKVRKVFLRTVCHAVKHLLYVIPTGFVFLSINLFTEISCLRHLNKSFEKVQNKTSSKNQFQESHLMAI